MRNNLRHIIPAGAAWLICLATALVALPAGAGINRWNAIGPDGANVVALAIDPVTPSTAFAGTLGSGVLKTTDGGASWGTANSGLPTVNVMALAIDPSTSSTLYAGTDAGVFKSTDGGQSWAAANTGLDGAPQITVNALAIDPATPATLYAGTPLGVSKTTNGAVSWVPINAGLAGLAARVITIDPTSPSTVYIGVDDTIAYIQNGIFKSTDGGTRWTRIYTVPCGFMCDGAPSVATLAIDPHSPSRLYVEVAGGGLVQSVDGGASWSDVNVPETNLSSLAIDPASSGTIYVGTYSGSVFRTTDAGDHWTSVSDGLQASSVNVIAMAASAPAAVYAGGGNGIFRSSDGAQTWTRLTLGVRNIGVGPIAVDPATPSTIYIDAAGRITKTTDGGAHWADSSVGLPGGWISSLVTDPASPSMLYAGDSSALFKSTDAGAHWAHVTSFFDFVTMAIAPSQPSTLYVGVDFSGVLKSTDGGSTWTYVNNGLTAVGPYVSRLAVDPTNADIVYVATPPTGRPNTDAKFFKSTDGAAHWRQVPINLPTNTAVTSLVIDPVTPSTIYATYDAYGAVGVGVFKSSDSGETWIAPTNLLPTALVSTLAIDPTLPSRVYAATPDGVFASSDGAMSWAPLNSGLPSLAVYGLSIDRTGTLLRAATGAGLFEYQFAGPPPPGTVAVIEYYYSAFDHYFMTSNTDEITKLDNGGFPGWVRTGLRFNAYAVAGSDNSPVCRFFSTAFAPKSSHFYSVFSFECDAVQMNPIWSLESSAAFYIAVPAGDGSCAAGLTPVYRLYNNGQSAAPNHRYTTDWNVRAQMITQGWVPEGLGANSVGMCSPSSLPSLPTESTWNGSFTWVSATAQRALCPEITSQIGGSWPLWIGMQIEGSSVTLSLAEGPPSNDPMDEGPALYRGTISGNSISASNVSLGGGFACPGDLSVTRQTGGNLTATVSGRTIIGNTTDVFGEGANAVVLLFRFTASY